MLAYEYSVSDHLGSDRVTYDGAGLEQNQRGHLKPGETQQSERQSYDAWGSRRDPATWAAAPGQLGPQSATWPGQPPAEDAPERPGSNAPGSGYTGHEGLDDVGLVHMNGRLYDPALGRMCAVDGYVQAPEAVQNHNRYSYVLNNPLNAVDPSGHNWLRKVLQVVVAVIVAVIVAMVAFYLLSFVGTAASSVTSVAVGAAGSAGLSAGRVAANGGSFTDIMKAGVTSGLITGVTAGIANWMHSAFAPLGSALTPLVELGARGVDISITATVAHVAAHGVVGGAMSEALGGSFRDGFIAAVITAGVAGVTNALWGNTTFMQSREAWAVAGQTVMAGIIGGAASVATGGKFAHAALTSAFLHLYNGLAQNLADGRGNDAEAAIEAAQRETDAEIAAVGTGLAASVVVTAINAPPTGRAVGGLLGKLWRPIANLFRFGKPAASAVPSAFERMLQAGLAIDRGGLTKAGRALEKHGSRLGSAFPQATGDIAAKNLQGERVLRELLSAQTQTIRLNRYGGRDIFDAATGRGVRFDGNGNFVGFLEP